MDKPRDYTLSDCDKSGGFVENNDDANVDQQFDLGELSDLSGDVEKC